MEQGYEQIPSKWKKLKSSFTNSFLYKIFPKIFLVCRILCLPGIWEFFAAFDEEYDAMAAEGTKEQGLRHFDEYLIMTCWMVSGHAVLAFPSKYATDEISTHDWQVISNPRDSKYVKKIGNVKLVI